MSYRESVKKEILARLTHCAQSHESIRAMLLYSSRANPHASVDRFSDYDILLAVEDVGIFHQDQRWLGDFGEVMVVLRNSLWQQHGFEMFVFVAHYLDGTKIDYAFYPTEFLTWACAQPKLPDDLDNDYWVLLDKDGLTTGLAQPTYQAYLPCPPSQEQYQATIESFFNDALYVAKAIWREDLFLLKYCLDNMMKFGDLRQMLEWHIGIAHDWSLKPGAYGKGLKKRVEPTLWAELERTYTGAGGQENWQALFATIELFQKVAVEVGAALGYSYSHALDENVTRYLHKVRANNEAKGFDGYN